MASMNFNNKDNKYGGMPGRRHKQVTQAHCWMDTVYFQKENPAVRMRRSGERLVAIGHACRNLPVIIRKHITRETPCLQDSQKWRLRLPLDLTIPVTHFFAT